MNKQQFFTSLLENHHIKISEVLNELHIEVINLDTSNISSCIITEHDLDPKDSIWVENLNQLSQSFFKGLHQPSENLKVSITEETKISLFMASPQETAQSNKVFVFKLEDIHFVMKLTCVIYSLIFYSSVYIVYVFISFLKLNSFRQILVSACAF